VNQWRKDDPEVNARLSEAEEVGTQGLVSAAIQRAVHGVPKGVYYKGVKVDEETQYSDSLLTTLLKAKIDDFKAQDERSGGVHVNVNVANLMPRASSYDEWLTMKERTIRPALEAPTDTPIDVEYAEVKVRFHDIDL
jgi:hypothetical protein